MKDLYHRKQGQVRARRDSNPRQTWYRKPPLYPTELRAHDKFLNVSISNYKGNAARKQ